MTKEFTGRVRSIDIDHRSRDDFEMSKLDALMVTGAGFFKMKYFNNYSKHFSSYLLS
jgi:hypothetical protein